ncbi:MarR family transcriptional regulator [Loigolactobacillus coryniformis]|uniref:MarR family winged helix-turn-helix transcriptional regulator n=1 Tax=Loigolactobacillus coryniformis TaxID=1610 RepID=UPI0023406D1C|nr:MarR family transcriptional regulator [Loigolactobacillus coryniformis]MDC4186604.1 MarR family transcriptional regulator [Loigolactobacillus coryniformis]
MIDEMDSYIRQFNLVAQKIRQYLNQQLKDLNLTASTYFFILKVGERGTLSQEELFKVIYLNPSNVTRRLNRLIKLGYVVKEKSLTDGRSRVIKLTALGQQQYQQLLQRLPQINQTLVDSFDTQQRTTLQQFLGIVDRDLDQLLSNKGDELNG